MSNRIPIRKTQDGQAYIDRADVLRSVASNTSAPVGAPAPTLSGSLIPDSGCVYDIGSASNTYRDLYLCQEEGSVRFGTEGKLSFSSQTGWTGGSFTQTGAFLFNRSLLPTSEGLLLGTLENPWRHLYLSEGSLNIGKTVISEGPQSLNVSKPLNASNEIQINSVPITLGTNNTFQFGGPVGTNSVNLNGPSGTSAVLSFSGSSVNVSKPLNALNELQINSVPIKLGTNNSFLFGGSLVTSQITLTGSNGTSIPLTVTGSSLNVGGSGIVTPSITLTGPNGSVPISMSGTSLNIDGSLNTQSLTLIGPSGPVALTVDNSGNLNLGGSVVGGGGGGGDFSVQTITNSTDIIDGTSNVTFLSADVQSTPTYSLNNGTVNGLSKIIVNRTTSSNTGSVAIVSGNVIPGTSLSLDYNTTANLIWSAIDSSWIVYQSSSSTPPPPPPPPPPSTTASFGWGARISGNDAQLPNDVLVDSENNVYVYGSFGSTSLSLYNVGANVPTKTLTQDGTRSMFLVKYNSAGTILWATKIVNTESSFFFDGSYLAIPDIVLGSDDKIYLMSHHFAGSTPTVTTFYNQDGTPFTKTLNVQANQIDTFVACYSKDGNAEWVTEIRGVTVNGNDRCFKMEIDGNDNLYIVGRSTSSGLTFFNSDNSSLSQGWNWNTAGGDDVFLVKYNKTGFAQWATRIGGTSSDYPRDLVVDSSGNSCVTGFYESSTLSFISSTGVTFTRSLNAGVGFYNVYTVYFNSSGIVQWVAGVETENNTISFNVAFDGNNNVYASGSYVAPVIVRNSDNTIFKTLSAGSVGTFLIKFNKVDGMVDWVADIVSTTDVSPASERNIQFDSQGNVYLYGYTQGTTTFYDARTDLDRGSLSDSSIDTFLVKYEPVNGVVQWFTALTGVTSNVQPVESAIDSTGNLYLTGYYSSNPLTIANSDGTIFGTLSNNGGGYNDIFIVKYDNLGFAKWSVRIGGQSADVSTRLFVDSNNNVYSTGYYQSSTLDFYNSNGNTSSTTLSGVGYYDIYTAKIVQSV